ncbi:MAG: methyltransferase domain-containing protein [Rhodobacterales bacterium]|nr:methyltransferase domain-containing protein [Rhodobacterales bacterium]
MTDGDAPHGTGPARKGTAGSGVPAGGMAKQAQRQIDKFLASARGLHPRFCPICGARAKFAVFGHPPRFDARCTQCGSLERHRLFALFVERNEFFKPGQVVLHFAPERQLTPLIQSVVGTYETADLSTRKPMTHHTNIEATGLPSDHYDRIICNHVLEHVDDKKALSEIFRILKPGGKAILSSPVVEGWAQTYENPDVRTPAERVVHFGQADHVRFYGRDIRDRIKAPGFTLAEFTAVEPDVLVYGLNRGETMFIATKPA